MDVTYEKEVCYFVGGIGSKAGTDIAGGCTKEWLAAQNGDPAALFGADGGCVYSNASIQIGTNRRITGPAGTFSGVQAGMAAWITAVEFSSGYFEVTAVGSEFEYVDFAGANEVYFPETITRGTTTTSFKLKTSFQEFFTFFYQHPTDSQVVNRRPQLRHSRRRIRRPPAAGRV